MPGRTYMAGSFSRLNRHLVGPLKHCTLPPYATRPTRHSNAPHWGFHTRAKLPKGCRQRMPQWWPLMVISEQALAPATPSTPMCGSVVAGVCSPPQNCERNIVAMGMGERARTVGSAAIAPLQRLLRPMAQPALCATQPDSFSEYVAERAARKNNRRSAHCICSGNGVSERQF